MWTFAIFKGDETDVTGNCVDLQADRSLKHATFISVKHNFGLDMFDYSHEESTRIYKSEENNNYIKQVGQHLPSLEDIKAPHERQLLDQALFGILNVYMQYRFHY